MPNRACAGPLHSGEFTQQGQKASFNVSTKINTKKKKKEQKDSFLYSIQVPSSHKEKFFNTDK